MSDPTPETDAEIAELIREGRAALMLPDLMEGHA